MVFTTDKIAHGYFPTYLRLAGEIGMFGRVCEIGVWHGESLEMWRALFPHGVIVGVDNASTDPMGTVWPAGTEQVFCNQDSPMLPSMVAAHSPEYDLIVDDASHQGGLTKATFELLWPLVAPGRYYVVEDWQVSFLPDWDNSMRETVQSFLDHLRVEGDAEKVEYRYGMAIVQKAR